MPKHSKLKPTSEGTDQLIGQTTIKATTVGIKTTTAGTKTATINCLTLVLTIIKGITPAPIEATIFIPTNAKETIVNCKETTLIKVIIDTIARAVKALTLAMISLTNLP